MSLKVYLFIGIALVGTSSVAYYGWKKNIEHQALLEFNRKQIEQAARDQEEFNRHQRDLAQKQEEIANELQRKTEQLNRQMQNIDGILNSAEAKKNDRSSSAVLQQTIEQLARGVKK